MTTLREAAEVALAVLEEINKLSLAPGGIALPGEIDTAMDLIRAAIVPSDCSDSHPPDAWMTEARNDLGLPVFFCASEVKQAGPGLIPLYTSPPAQQEPVAWMIYTLDGKSVFVTDNPTDFTPEHQALPLYTSPPQRQWQELTNEEIDWIKGSANRAIGYIRVTQAKLKEKNT